MTISYKLFGIPRTFDEFVDKVKKKNGEKRLDVILRLNMIPDLSPKLGSRKTTLRYKTYVGVRAGRTRLTISKNNYPFSRDFDVYNRQRYEFSQKATTEAIETAEKLQNFGLEATINKMSVDEIKEASRKLGEAYHEEFG